MSGLCVEGPASTAVFLLLSHVCTQGLSVSSLTMIKDSTKVLLSWENHYFYEVQSTIYLKQLLPKGKTQGIISCTCRYNCTLLCTVTLKALEGFKCRNELSLKILVYWPCTASCPGHASISIDGDNIGSTRCCSTNPDKFLAASPEQVRCSHIWDKQTSGL